MKGEGQTRWRPYGGYLVLVAAALLLVLGGQIRWAGDWWATRQSAESPALVLRATPVETSHPTATPTRAAGQQVLATAVPLPVLNDHSLAPVQNPYTFRSKPPSHDFQTYVVERGDTPNSIADKFSISPETLLGGNPWLSEEANQLQAGVELVILPADGVLHTVKPGGTLESISEQYQIPVANIIAYESNNLEFPYRLHPESKLLIPGAKIGEFYWKAPKSVAGSGGSQQWAVIGTGSFAWPVTGRCATTSYWYGHPGLDIGLPVGSPVVAADRGTVTWASWASGPYFDYGNLIVINHGNGYETLYAHLSGINVYAGQTVEKGQFIGTTGNTGRSSGPHIHLEIRFNDFRDNPLNYLSGPVKDCSG